MYLIDGRAESEIESYVTEQHTFEEFSVKVKFFDNLGKELTDSLPKEVNLGMFSLHCEDLILNLYRKTGVLRELILKVKNYAFFLISSHWTIITLCTRSMKLCIFMIPQSTG